VVGELVTVGDELLSGRVVNSNAAHIARHLGLAGYELRWMTVVGDREDDIVASLVTAMDRSTFVLVTGGLGPTTDDRTTAAAARALGRPLERDPVSWHILVSHLEKRKMAMTPEIAKMADLPAGAQRIDLTRPRAGFFIGDAGKPLFFLPGVPDEMADMVREFVLPTLQLRVPVSGSVQTRLLRTFGLQESEIGGRLAGLEEQYPALRLGYLPRYPENHLALSVRGTTPETARALLDEIAAEVNHRLGRRFIYGEGDDTLEMVVGRLLQERGEVLALAESCTGGLIAHLVTNVPGSSAYLDRSLVTYSDGAKTELLAVPAATISRFGSVSAETTQCMVRGLLHGTVTMALAVTGYAGPTGGTPAAPVGTVFLALSYRGRERLREFRFRGSRWEIKSLTAHTALNWLRRAMIDEGFFGG
jgi:competence/damage-inducible protein CinA-like protein